MSFATKPLILIPTADAFSPSANIVVIQDGEEAQVPLAALPGSGFDVTGYGALGDGATECSSEIQDALNACAAVGGGTVRMPPGVYMTDTPLEVGASVRLLGEGATIKSVATSDGAKVVFVGSGASVEGLILDGAKVGTSGSGTFDYGLVEVVRNNASAYTGLAVRRCTIQNSDGCGVRILGNIDGFRIDQRCIFAGNFLDIFGEKAGSYIYRNVSIVSNEFNAGWYNGEFSGAVKLKGAADEGLYVTNLDISFNIIRCTHEMGIEIWNGFRDSVVAYNQITGPDFGISINLSRGISIVGNKVWRNNYCGIEIAEGSTFCVIQGNTVEQYALGTTTPAHNVGIITSGATHCADNIYQGNTVRGCLHSAFALHNSDRTSLVDNRFEDSEVLIEVKNSSYVVVDANHLYGPCHYHFFINVSDLDATDVDIVRNTLYGLAANDNLIYYDGSDAHTLTNLRVAWNNLAAASYTSLSFNKFIPDERCPNLQCYENFEVAGDHKASWPDFTTNAAAIPPYAPSIQRAGISVAAKNTVTAAASGSARWVKVFSHDYGASLYLPCHFFAGNPSNGDTNALTAIIAAAPYGLNSSITVLPNAKFNGVIEEVIYTNHDAIHEVWLKLKATAYDWTIDCYWGDYPTGIVVTPSLVTSSPTWDTNNYRVQVELDRPHSLLAAGLHAQRWIASGPRGIPAALKGRLHIVGAADEGGVSDARIAILETAAEEEAVGVDETGLLLVKKKMSVGAGPSLSKILSGDTDIAFGTIAANSEVGYGIYVPGARAAGNPSITIGIPPITNGVAISRYYVSADDVVDFFLRNNSGSGISVGTLNVRATLFYF